MNLSEGLAKLRPTKVRDRSGVDISEAMRLEKQAAEAYAKMMAVNVENWFDWHPSSTHCFRYPYLKDFTFASSWFPINTSLAQILIDEYQHYLTVGKGTVHLLNNN